MRRLLLSIVGFPLFLAACTGAGTGAYGGGASATPSPSSVASGPTTAPVATPAPIAATPTPTATPVPPRAASLIARGSALGTILTDSRGRTLYYFVPERGGRIVCSSSACTTYWPPSFASSANPTAGGHVSGRLTVIMRAGGDQLVYNNWPLYTFAGDSAAGQTNGQGVVGFGGKWLVATPSLRP